MKKCSYCEIEKSTSEFNKSPHTADRLRYDCRECQNKNDITYRRSIRGSILSTYDKMKKRVTGRNRRNSHLYIGKSILPKEVFINWASNDKEFISLYNKWVESGYEISYRPTIDRIDSNKGYDLDNIRFLTHKENSYLGSLNARRKRE